MSKSTSGFTGPLPGAGLSEVSTPTARTSSGAFDNYPDFAKFSNARRHTDTFSTPRASSTRAVHKTQSSPSGPLGARDLMDICELCFTKKLRDSHHSLLKDLRLEIQEALGPLKDELSGTMADARGVLALEEILQQLSHLKVPPVDLAPFTSAMESAAISQQEAARRLESQLGEEIVRLREEVRVGRQQQEAAEGSRERRVAELEDAVLRSQAQLSKVVGMQETLCETTASTAEEVQQLQQRSRQYFDGLSASLEEQISKHMQHQTVDVNFEQVFQHVTRQTTEVHTDMMYLLGEIGKIQQALNVDFAAQLDLKFSEMAHTMSTGPSELEKRHSKSDADSRGASLASKAKRRVRHGWSQTDAHETAEAFCQADLLVAEQPKKKRLPSKKKVADANSQALKGMKKANTTTKPVFTDTEAMKQRARNALIRPQHNVFDDYHETGCMQAIAKSQVFELATLFVILANAIWIAVDTDLNNATVLIEAPLVFQIIEHVFCVYFTIEIVVRFVAYREKRLCLSDAWFMFDSALVLMMVIETWIFGLFLGLVMGSQGGSDLGSGSILRVMKIVKMLRISRMARLLRSMPELLILLKGVKAASRSVLVFFGLWLVIIYVYALIFRHLAKDASTPGDSKYFGSVPAAMNTLLLEGILPDYASMVNEVAIENFLFYPLMLTFIVLAVMTLMNMLVGVLVEVVGAIAISEKEGMVAFHLASELRAWMESHSYDLDLAISKQQFQKLLVEPQVTRIVNDVGVDVLVLLDMSETMFDDLQRSGAQGMRYEDFVGLILDMRGTNPAKVKDVKEQLRLIKFAVNESISNVMNKVNTEIFSLHREVRAMRVDMGADMGEESDFDEEGDDVELIPSESIRDDSRAMLIDVAEGDGGAGSI